MQLNEFQERFKALMLDHPDALNTPPEDLAAFCAEGDIALPTRLKVYRNNIVGSLTDLLKVTFPVLQKLVGEKFFETLARSFILENPPRKGVLSHYGEGLDDFIKTFEPTKSMPYLADIAAYEIAKNHSYHAADDLPLTPEQLASIPPEELANLSINLRRHVFLIQSAYPLTAIETFCLQNDPDGTLDMDQGGEQLMVFRQNFESVTLPLSDDEFVFLKKLQNGKTLGEATEETMTDFSDFDIQAILQKHLQLETFCADARI